MAFTSWNTAHGEAAPAYLQCASTVALSPADDSVDTNTVVIQGAGTILSFGDTPHVVLKRVKFEPLVMAGHAPPGGGGGGGASITLENNIRLNLLSGQRRSINDEAYGMYFCPGDGNWNEVYFVQKGTPTVMVLEDRIANLESRLNVLEGKVST